MHMNRYVQLVIMILPPSDKFGQYEAVHNYMLAHIINEVITKILQTRKVAVSSFPIDYKVAGT